ncbi:MAG: energy transducer TonB [Terriglobales bacterium]
MLLYLQLAFCALALLSPSFGATAALHNASGTHPSLQIPNGEDTVAALPIRMTNPRFPKLKKKKSGSNIVLSICVSTNGIVKDPSVVRGDPALVNAAIEAVRQWLYLPAMRHGEFVESTEQVTIEYPGKKDFQPEEQAAGGLGEPPKDLLKDVADGTVLRVGKGTDVIPLRTTVAPDPQYTEEARINRVRGKVLLGVVVGSKGEVKSVWVVQGLEQSLDLASIETVKGWKFSPASKNGEAVAVVVNLETSFDIY